jgi:hypothetical protein
MVVLPDPGCPAMTILYGGEMKFPRSLSKPSIPSSGDSLDLHTTLNPQAPLLDFKKNICRGLKIKT